MEAILKEVAKLKTEKVGGKELEIAKEKLKGRILLSLETPDKLAEWYGSQELLQPKALTISETFNQIDKVTSQDIQKVASELFADKNLSLSMVGPVTKSEKIAERLTFRNL